MLKLLAGVATATGLFFSNLFGLNASVPEPAPVAQSTPLFGNINPTGGGTYYLRSTISATQTTITLSSFTEPVSNIPYTMSYLNSSIEYATIAPQSTLSEFVSFTGITQNSDGSATLTGVVRGLGRSYPYTASSTLAQPHAGQSRFILSNPPQLYNSYGALSNANVWTAINTFASTSKPVYDGNPTFGASDGLAFVNYSTLLSTAISGAGTSTEGAMGISQLATYAQAAAGTASSTTGAPLVLKAGIATSTCQAARNSVLVASSTTGQLDGRCLDTSSNAYTWSKTQTFTNGILSQASSTSVGTTSIAANSVTNRALILNGLAYQFGGSRAASSTVLSEDGNGRLTFETPQVSISTISSTAVDYSSSGTSTIASYTVAANTLAASRVLHIQSWWSNNGAFQCNVGINVGNGTATSSVGYAGANTLVTWMGLDATVLATSTTAAAAFSYTSAPFGGSVARQVAINTTGYTGVSFDASTGNNGNICRLIGYSVQVLTN